jgi:hypothetical protein
MPALMVRHNCYKSCLRSQFDHNGDIPPLLGEVEAVDNGALVERVVVHKATHHTFYTPGLPHC